ncbi:integrase arm-type DNA-binding domain-containing protein [Rhizobium leguminosarum]|uniref:Arm DNA-binding domain-containing protein n=1 Tax=Rhizobium leguminosarum TaxID=384 RepID=UPI003F9AF034
MPLTDVQIKNAKTSGKPYKLPDGRGLYLCISNAGGKSWRLDYAYFGKRRTLALGTYPALGLADARVRRDEAKRKLSDGLDPSLAKLARYGYPPDLQKAAVDLVVRQAEAIAADWG